MGRMIVPINPIGPFSGLHSLVQRPVNHRHGAGGVGKSSGPRDDFSRPYSPSVAFPRLPPDLGRFIAGGNARTDQVDQLRLPIAARVLIEFFHRQRFTKYDAYSYRFQKPASHRQGLKRSRDPDRNDGSLCRGVRAWLQNRVSIRRSHRLPNEFPRERFRPANRLSGGQSYRANWRFRPPAD